MNKPPSTILIPVPRHRAMITAAICSAGLAVFAFLIIYPYPFKLIAFIPLVITAFIISRNINWPVNASLFFVKNIYSLKLLSFCLIGLLMGIGGAMYYRGSFGMPVLPALFRSFVFVAMSIGIMEELVFRGFIQGRLSNYYPGFAIVFAAFAHATYKACLFLSPAAQQHHSLFLFYTWTFGAFILIGLLRHYSKSIVPALLVHAMFDLIVYAENLQAPWWVW